MVEDREGDCECSCSHCCAVVEAVVVVREDWSNSREEEEEEEGDCGGDGCSCHVDGC